MCSIEPDTSVSVLHPTVQPLNVSILNRRCPHRPQRGGSALNSVFSSQAGSSILYAGCGLGDERMPLTVKLPDFYRGMLGSSCAQFSALILWPEREDAASRGGVCTSLLSLSVSVTFKEKCIMKEC